MGDILSQDEIDALLSATEEAHIGAAEDSFEAMPPVRIVQNWKWDRYEHRGTHVPSRSPYLNESLGIQRCSSPDGENWTIQVNGRVYPLT